MAVLADGRHRADGGAGADRKSTRLNSSHTEIYTLSLHDALPISARPASFIRMTSARASRSINGCSGRWAASGRWRGRCRSEEHTSELQSHRDLHSFPTRRSSDLRKTGKFYPNDERARVEVDQWLFWQMGGIGPMAGQVHHFRNYAKETLTYAINRYVDEVNRLYGVMNLRLKDREFIAGKYSIADMAIVGWANGWERQGQDINQFPHFKRWLETMKARQAVKRGMTLGLELRQGIDMKDPKVQAVLFGQRARSA